MRGAGPWGAAHGVCDRSNSVPSWALDTRGTKWRPPLSKLRRQAHTTEPRSVKSPGAWVQGFSGLGGGAGGTAPGAAGAAPGVGLSIPDWPPGAGAGIGAGWDEAAGSSIFGAGLLEDLLQALKARVTTSAVSTGYFMIASFSWPGNSPTGRVVEPLA